MLTSSMISIFSLLYLFLSVASFSADMVLDLPLLLTDSKNELWMVLPLIL